MGKSKVKKNKAGNSELPFVSVCTPTYNRRPFIQSMICCFNHQTYPKERMEWIIIDDGTDKIEDLVKDIPEVKYFKYDKKMVLGKKRNLLHKKSVGDIIVYMDDDDYYPPERVSHSVNMLQTHPRALCAGASEIYIYFKHIDQMVQFGPYGPNHATAGTFAFKRELLKDHAYDNEAALAEEKSFLKHYTVPFVQLEPKKTILVFSHIHNTFDKKKLLDNKHPNFVKDSDKTVDDFVKQADLKDFYMNKIEELLVDYEPGRPDMKPDVLKQIDEINNEREKMMEGHKQEMMNLICELQNLAPQNPIKAMELMQKNPPLMQHMIQHNSGILQKIQGDAIMQQQQMFQQQMSQNTQSQTPKSLQYPMTQEQSEIEQYQSQQSQQQIMGNINGEQRPLNNDQVVEILRQQQGKIHELMSENEQKDKLITELKLKLKLKVQSKPKLESKSFENLNLNVD